MSLKNVVETLDDIPEALHEHYTKKDDNFVLVHDANDAVDQFRANNVALREKVEGLETRLKTFDGMDADKYKELETLERQKRDKELIDSGDVETLINEKIDVQKTEYEKRLDAVNVELSNVRGELVATKVTDQLKSAAASAGVRSDALNDVVAIASGDWELREGATVRVQNSVSNSQYSLVHFATGGKSDRTKELRSITPMGFARAFFEANNPANLERKVQPT